MENLLPEIIHEILVKLPDSDIYSALCNSWNQSANGYFWRIKCGASDWKDAYKMLNRYAISTYENIEFVKILKSIIHPNRDEELIYRN